MTFESQEICLLVLILIAACLAKEVFLKQSHDDERNFVMKSTQVVNSVLEITSKPDCSTMIMADRAMSSFSSALAKALDEKKSPRGVSVFTFAMNSDGRNESKAALSQIISEARKVRKISWCLSVIVVSEDVSFLKNFAIGALQGRFLVWKTRLLIVTRLELHQLSSLLKGYWTFSMMNTLFLNMEASLPFPRCHLYIYLPYSPTGAGEVKLGLWTEAKGLQISSNQKLFPQKYTNFHKAVVNVSSKPWPPYWTEEKVTKPDGTKDIRISGTDGLLLHAVSQSLNFTFYNVPTANWVEVEQKVISREAYISPIRYTMIPERLAMYDMSYVYDYSALGFCMTKPPLRPQWESLLYPLTLNVWLVTIGCLLVVPGFLFAVSYSSKIIHNSKGHYSVGYAILDTLRILLGQPHSSLILETNPVRILILTWLLFAFIVGIVYKSSLTAYLTLPKYPQRPESMEELVEAVDTVWAPYYALPFKDFFMKSSYPVYQKFGKMLVLGPETEELIARALKNRRSAAMDIKRYMTHIVADKFTEADGTTQLYLGRNGLVPGRASWPVPHDAPFLSNIEWRMQAAVEAGLYENWSSDITERSRRESMRRKQEVLKQTGKSSQTTLSEGEKASQIALTLKHMQGPLFLLIGGWILASLSFIVERLG